jgi:DNA-binding transcriptional MerR regulator
MTMQLETTYGIGEVSELTGITAHTLRFYEKEGLFVAPVRRDASGRRRFTSDEVAWLRVCVKLRSSGMPLPEMRRYAELVVAGEHTVEERFAILRRHEDAVRRQVADLEEALAVIGKKVATYARHLDAGTAASLWSDGPSC